MTRPERRHRLLDAVRKVPPAPTAEPDSYPPMEITAPPAIVMMLAAFWSLVPGALSFVAVGQAAAGQTADATSLAATGAAIMSIALGTLVGWSVFYTIDSRLPWAKDARHTR